MTEDYLIEKYTGIGYVSPNKELFLPITIREAFVNECSKLMVAIIAIELFHKKGNGIVPVNPISGVDCTSIIYKNSSWVDIVQKCNNCVLNVLNEENKNDETLLFNPTLLEEVNWK